VSKRKFTQERGKEGCLSLAGRGRGENGATAAGAVSARRKRKKKRRKMRTAGHHFFPYPCGGRGEEIEDCRELVINGSKTGE